MTKGWDSLSLAGGGLGVWEAPNRCGYLNHLLKCSFPILASLLHMCICQPAGTLSSTTYTSYTMAKHTKPNVKPLGDRVLLQRLSEDTEEVKGGIIIPDTAKEKPQEATVIALGTGKVDKDGKSVAWDVKLGDTVLIGKYAGTEVKLNDEIYILLREEEILAVIR